MTVAVLGSAGRAAAAAGGTRAAAGAGSRAGSGQVIEGKLASKKPANAQPSKSGKSGGLAGDLLSGAAQGSALRGGLRSPTSSGKTGPGSPARRMLVAEFAVCMVLLAFSPVTDQKKSETPAAFMKRGSAIMALFFVLGLIASGGDRASRAAAGFGALVTLGLAISSRSVFVVLTKKFATDAGENQPQGPGVDETGEWHNFEGDDLEGDDRITRPDQGRFNPDFGR